MAHSQLLSRLSGDVNTLIESIISRSGYDDFSRPQRLPQRLIDILVELRLLETNIRHNKDSLDDLALLCPSPARLVRLSLRTTKDLISDVAFLSRHSRHWMPEKLLSKDGDVISAERYHHRLRCCRHEYLLAIEQLHRSVFTLLARKRRGSNASSLSSAAHPHNTMALSQRSRIQSRLVLLNSPFIRRMIHFKIAADGLLPTVKLKMYRTHKQSAALVRHLHIGNLDGVKEMIDSGQAHVNEGGEDGWTTLHTAAYEGHIDIVRYLLDRSADPDLCDVNDRKAWHFAKFKSLKSNASIKDVLMAKLFHEEQYFNIEFELSPILVAVLRQYDEEDKERPDLSAIIKVAEELRDHGGSQPWSLWRRDFRHRSPLFQDLIVFFQEYDEQGLSGEDAFKDILNKTDAIHKWNSLLWAAYVGRMDEFVELLLHGVDPFDVTSSRRNVLHHAADSDSDDIILYLLENNYHLRGLEIDLPDLWNETPLLVAAARSYACSNVLLRYGASTEARSTGGHSPLHHLRYVQDDGIRFQLLRLFLENGVDVNGIDGGGRTALFYLLKSPICVTTLLDLGCHIKVTDENGRTVFHFVCDENYPQVLSHLLSRSPPELMTLEDNRGDCPLLLSFRESRRECARILFEKAPIVSKTDKDGWSLLHHAARMGDLAVLRLVLAIPEERRSSVTNDGKSPIEVSEEAGTFTGEFARMLGTIDDIGRCKQ